MRPWPSIRALSQWRREPDLAGLRDAGLLARLPATERQECRALWSDLDARIKHAARAR
jgi:hypothetical protein